MTGPPTRPDDRDDDGRDNTGNGSEGNGSDSRSDPDNGTDDDASLVSQSLEHPEVFAGLYDRHAPDIHRYAARRLGEGAADDITAETFLIAFRSRRRYDTARRNARPWLYGIAANLIGKQRRSEERGLRALARTGEDPVAASWSGSAAVTGELRLNSLSEVLNRAADVVARQPAVAEPRADQWIYTRVKMAPPETYDGSPDKMRITYDPDSWVPYDNSAAAKNGEDSDYRTAMQDYRAADRLPDDPARLLAKVRALYPTGNTAESPPEPVGEHTFRAMGLLIEAYPITPAARARLYRALATVPGVKVVDHMVKDAAGRDAIAITRKQENGHERREILLDPTDYSYTGTRFVVTEDHSLTMSTGKAKLPPEKFRAGQVLSSEARVAAAVVDHEGEKP